MMYGLCALIASAILLPNTAFCHKVDKHNKQVEETSTGIIHHGKVRLESLKGNGRVTLDETQVAGPAEVNGSIFAQGAHLGSATINGQATLYNTTVEGKFDIAGFMNAEKCTFRSKIEATCQKVSFCDCNINSIHVRKTLWPFSMQVVELSNCNCRGDITFDSGKGLVVLCNKSQLQGKVIGGDIQKG